jgi:phosphate transport system substrate-binding protein
MSKAEAQTQASAQVAEATCSMLSTREKGMSLRSTHKAIGALGVTMATLAFAPVAGAQTLFGSGSSAAQPYMLKLFKGYSALHPKIHFSYNPNGGNAGVTDVQARRTQFAIQTRPPLPSDSGTTYFKLFLDGLCIGVNPSNNLSDISLSQLKNVFLGTDTNWSQVPGSNLSSTIDPVGRNSTAGTYTFFQQAVLGGQTQSSNVRQAPSDGLVAVDIHQDANAIGYVGLAHSGAGSGVKRLTVGGVACSDATIKKESYPLFRYVWAVLPTAHPSTQVEKFLDWVRVTHAAGKIISAAGAVPAFNH